eukprot:491564-Prymnesium_polylepis.1
MYKVLHQVGVESSLHEGIIGTNFLLQVHLDQLGDAALHLQRLLDPHWTSLAPHQRIFGKWLNGGAMKVAVYSGHGGFLHLGLLVDQPEIGQLVLDKNAPAGVGDILRPPSLGDGNHVGTSCGVKHQPGVGTLFNVL